VEALSFRVGPPAWPCPVRPIKRLCCRREIGRSAVRAVAKAVAKRMETD
jgi:hypothetical protein